MAAAAVPSLPALALILVAVDVPQHDVSGAANDDLFAGIDAR